MPRQRSRLRGDKGFRKLLRQIPDAAREQMADVMAGIGAQLAAEMRIDVPRRTGALQSGITFKLARRSLRLRIGLVGPKKQQRDLFYGRIVEFGRNEQDVKIKRGPRAGSTMHVGKLPPRPFVLKRRAEMRRELGNRLRNYWGDVLTVAAAGGDLSDD